MNKVLLGVASVSLFALAACSHNTASIDANTDATSSAMTDDSSTMMQDSSTDASVATGSGAMNSSDESTTDSGSAMSASSVR